MQRELSMLQSHDLAFSRFCADGELIGQSLRRDDERMIARSGKWVWQSGENARPIVMDLRGFAVHQPLRLDNLSAKNFRDALVTQANTEQWHARREPAHDFFAYSRFAGACRSGRDANMRRLQPGNFINREGVVTPNNGFTAKLAKILDEVVGERIVIIEDEQHGFAWLRRPDESPSLPRRVVGTRRKCELARHRKARGVDHYALPR